MPLLKRLALEIRHDVVLQRLLIQALVRQLLQKIRRLEQAHDDRVVFTHVGLDVQRSAGFQGLANCFEQSRLEQTALVVLLLRPGVAEENDEGVHRFRREVLLHEIERIHTHDADVGQPAPPPFFLRPLYLVAILFHREEIHVRPSRRLCGKEDAASAANFNLRARGSSEQRIEVDRLCDLGGGEFHIPAARLRRFQRRVAGNFLHAHNLFLWFADEVADVRVRHLRVGHALQDNPRVQAQQPLHRIAGVGLADLFQRQRNSRAALRRTHEESFCEAAFIRQRTNQHALLVLRQKNFLRLVAIPALGNRHRVKGQRDVFRRKVSFEDDVRHDGTLYAGMIRSCFGERDNTCAPRSVTTA